MTLRKISIKLVLTITFSIAILSNCTNPRKETSNPNEFNTEEVTELVNMPKEGNDGRLSLNIILINSKNICYSPGQLIPIVAEYHNLTNIAIQIADYDVVAINPLIGAKAQIYPHVYKKDGEEIFTQEHLTYSQYSYTKETKVNSLEPNDSMIVRIESFFFPLKIITTSTTGSTENITPPSGDYLIQFGYVNVGTSEYWEGSISSNVIEICIE